MNDKLTITVEWSQEHFWYIARINSKDLETHAASPSEAVRIMANFLKSLEEEAIKQLYGLKVTSDPSVPASEVLFKDQEGKTVGKIANLKES